MVADDGDTSHPYVNVKGHTVDQAMLPEVLAPVCHLLFTNVAEMASTTQPPCNKQFSLRAGLKRFGDHGKEALRKEMSQFHMLNCFQPLDPSTLSRDDCRQALLSLLFLTKNGLE
jgi:hypothetical protein